MKISGREIFTETCLHSRQPRLHDSHQSQPDWSIERGHPVSGDNRRALRRHSRPHLGRFATGIAAMNWMYWLSGLLAAGLLVYLLYALFRAEKF